MTRAGIVRRLGKLALAMGLCLGIAAPAWAMSPRETLEGFFARANTALQAVQSAQGLEVPRQAIRDLVNETFDFRAAAAVALGPLWLSRVPEDQDAFTRLFGIFLERGFVAMIGSKASVAGGVKIQYLDESIDGESAAVATTLLTRGGQELPVVYWMIRQGSGWKVQDVVVDGVSLVMNYRAQFARVLAALPYTELVARMQGEAPPESAPAASFAGPGPSEQPKGDGGTRREGPVAAPAPGDVQQLADVVGRLLVRSRSGAERDVAALLTRAGGTTVSRQRGPTSTVVTGVVPQSSYDTFAAGLRSIGSWQLEAERSPLPNLLHVTVRLAE